jgi:hypothetical protein
MVFGDFVVFGVSEDSIIFGVDVLCGIWSFWDSIMFGIFFSGEKKKKNIDGFCDLWGLGLCTIWD